MRSFHSPSGDDFLFTSESVAEGHPDKVCDQISDTILDLYLAADPYARVAAESMVTSNKVIISGEVRGPESITRDIIEDATRQCIRYIGYEQEQFHWNKVNVEILLHKQSADIAMGVDSGKGKEEGAGDQGIMFGYASRETDTLMPAPLYYSHKILRLISEDTHAGKLKGLGPDAKSQVTLLYSNNMPVRATSVVVSIQHLPNLSQTQVRELVRPYVLKALPEGWMCEDSEFYVNPTGQFIIGGPESDTGLTGRKIIVDSYGGSAPHGGGAFSGKDPTKVDRSAAYAARYLAKNIVGAELARRCTLQIAYAIGVAKPLAFYINTHGTSHVDEQKLVRVLQEMMNLSPRGIREHLKLNRPIYKRTAAYGHFGREPEADGGFSWEKLDLVDALKAEFK